MLGLPATAWSEPSAKLRLLLPRSAELPCCTAVSCAIQTPPTRTRGSRKQGLGSHDVGRRAELARRARVYYADHRHDVIAHKTLVKTRTIGRIPRGATMLEHNITTDQVREALAEYMDAHPDTRAAKRAKLWLCHAADGDADCVADLDTCGLESCASSDESLETHD